VKLLFVKFVCCVYVRVCVSVWRRQAGGGGAEPGYRIKNKNPTQSCRKKTILKHCFKRVLKENHPCQN